MLLQCFCCFVVVAAAAAAAAANTTTTDLLAILFIQGALRVPMLLRMSLSTLPRTPFISLAVTVLTCCCSWL